MDKHPSRVKMVCIFAAIIFFLSTVSLLSAALFVSDKIFYGVNVEGMPLGGLSIEDAAKKMEKNFQNRVGGRDLVQLKAQDKTFAVNAEDIALNVDFTATAEQAFAVGRGRGFFYNLYHLVISSNKGMTLPYQIHFDENKLHTVIAAIHAQTALKKQDAHLAFNPAGIQLVPEVVGKALKADELMESLKDDISHLKFPISMELPLAVDEPAVTAADLEGIDTVLATYSSAFNTANVNRSENIRIAADSMNRLLLKPQAVVSFNERVGPRIVEAGFKEAPVIVEGKTVPDIGGGVCQVSSTLYNAILLADMQPVERTPHFHPLGYVPIGLDATVADNLLDFKFKNTLPHAAYIMAGIQNGIVTVTVLGNKADLSPYKISVVSHIDKVLEPKVVTQYDNALPAGKRIISEEGAKGYIVSSYRVKTDNGQEVSRELLYTDEYAAEDKIVIFGTMLPRGDGKNYK